MMKILLRILFCLILTSHFACKQKQPNKPADKNPAKSSAKNKPAALVPVLYDLKEITHDWSSVYGYMYGEVRMVRDFIPLNEDSSVTDKKPFIQKLATGKFYAVKTAWKDDVPVYRLFRLPPRMRDAAVAIRQLANQELANMNWEGKFLPGFDFKDLNGHSYTRNSVEGKIMVVKCWFIKCVACVAEFPELNELVKLYQHNRNIVFVSLAMDSRPALSAFMKKHDFRYAVVPDAESYMNDKLRINIYPTHILVGADGRIIKMVNTADDLAFYLEKELNHEKN